MTDAATLTLLSSRQLNDDSLFMATADSLREEGRDDLALAYHWMASRHVRPFRHCPAFFRQIWTLVPYSGKPPEDDDTDRYLSNRYGWYWFRDRCWDSSGADAWIPHAIKTVPSPVLPGPLMWQTHRGRIQHETLDKSIEWLAEQLRTLTEVVKP